MQQHLQRLDGVAKADVSLRDGNVVITAKPEASLDPYKILKAAYDGGVSVTEMRITSTGTVSQSGQTLYWQPADKQSFEITPGSQAEKLRPSAGSGLRRMVQGILYRKPPGTGKPKLPAAGLKLEITEIGDGR